MSKDIVCRLARRYVRTSLALSQVLTKCFPNQELCVEAKPGDEMEGNAWANGEVEDSM